MIKGIPLKDITGILPDNKTYKTTNKFILSRCRIGMEIEVENIMWPNTPVSQFWNITSDGSLRNHGIELISQPIFGEDILLAIDEANELLSQSRTPPDYSERTSVHIHMDVRNLNNKELFNLLILVIVFERVLVRYCGGGSREHNVFCLPFYKAGYGLDFLKDLQSDDPQRIKYALSDANKYNGFNILPVQRQGSVEFRYHHGTANKEELVRWINILYCLKRYARRIEGIDDFPSMVSQMGIKAFMERVFLAFSRYVLYDGVEDDVLDGIRLAQDIIYSPGLRNTIYNKRKVERVNKVATFHKKTKIKESDMEIPEDYEAEPATYQPPTPPPTPVPPGLRTGRSEAIARRRWEQMTNTTSNFATEFHIDSTLRRDR